MKILLVSLNRETEPFTAAPLGMALIRGSLERDGHEVKALDLLYSGEPEKSVDEAIRGFRPELVGLSLRNIESSTEFLMPGYRDTVARIRALTTSPIVVGGPGFSVMPEQTLRYLGADYGIKGEGEHAVSELVLALSKGRAPSDIPGVCSIDDGVFRMATPEAVSDLDALPPPSWTGLPVDGYDMVGVQSKRGCSFSCVYCTYPALEGRRMRLRDPASVARGIRSLVDEQGIRAFYFVDNVFNNPRKHALEVCREMSSLDIDVQWGCLASPIGLDEELLVAMKSAGCESVEIGADSLSDRVLKGLGKPFGAGTAEKAVSACKDAGLAHMLFLILGGPGEDERTLNETFSALDRLSPDKVFAVAGIRVYPGTPVHRMAVDQRLILPEDGLLEPRFYVSEKLGERLYGIAGEYFKGRPGWIYYRADGVLDKGQPVPTSAVSVWDTAAESCLEAMLNEIPRLLRPMAKKAVVKKAGRLAHARGLKAVTSSEVVDAFREQTPAPFRAAMENSLKKMGLKA